MRVFVFEHICGGGLSQQELTSMLVWEGGAMLRTAVEDFQAAGAEVLTCLDARIPLTLEGAKVSSLEPGTPHMACFDQLARAADATLVIAPEFDHLLENYARRLEQLGVRSLGSTPEGVAICSDKLVTAERLLAAGVPTVATHLGLPDRLDGPVVVKPRAGAGCQDTFVVRRPEELARLPKRDDFIWQPFVPGLTCSVAFLVHGERLRTLQAGEQFVRGRQQLSYHGGRMPLPLDLSERAITLGGWAARSVPGLRGYVGVDLMLGETADADRVIEVNARPTVAWVGLRRLCENSIAAAMLNPDAPLNWRNDRISYDASGTVSWEEEP
jgi:predicted ATP-grasp superfamily ATP-dependent carboligase